MSASEGRSAIPRAPWPSVPLPGRGVPGPAAARRLHPRAAAGHSPWQACRAGVLPRRHTAQSLDSGSSHGICGAPVCSPGATQPSTPDSGIPAAGVVRRYTPPHVQRRSRERHRGGRPAHRRRRPPHAAAAAAGRGGTRRSTPSARTCRRPGPSRSAAPPTSSRSSTPTRAGTGSSPTRRATTRRRWPWPPAGSACPRWSSCRRPLPPSRSRGRGPSGPRSSSRGRRRSSGSAAPRRWRATGTSGWCRRSTIPG